MSISTILILVLADLAIIVGLVWLWRRAVRQQQAATATLAATRQQVATAEAQTKIEIETRTKVETQLTQLAQALKANQAWYAEAQAKLDDATKEQYEKVRHDPAALDALLDHYLGR